MNVLLTSSGRRTYMVEYFKEALKPYGGKVHAMNSSIDAPALWLADYAVQAPLIYDSQYESFLLGYCLEHEIRIIISLFDIELPILSRLKPSFKEKGINIVVGDEWLTQMANDKWQTQEFLVSNSFKTVRSYLNCNDFNDDLEKGKVKFPVFVKPRWGMGSISVFKAENMEELDFFYRRTKKEIENSYLKYESLRNLDQAVLIQEAMPGREYGLDVINDLQGRYCNTIVKQKLAMRSGETDGAITVDEPMLRELGQSLSELTKHPGNMDVDVFFDGTSAYILELNPRFGGGYPFSHMSGVNLPKAIVEWSQNNSADMNELLNPTIGVKTMKGILMVSKSSFE